MSVWLLIAIGWGAMAVLMLGLWLVQRVRGNAGIVDIAWSLMTEDRAITSRGDAYRDDQRTTNMFFPGPPKARPA